jgi:hypothetical protein
MEWPAILGIYGAVVATVTAGWSIWSGSRDRGHLKLKLHMERYVQNTLSGELIQVTVDSLEGSELHLTAVNVGRRLVAIAAWRGVARGTGDITFGEQRSPKPLDETGQCSLVSREFAGAFRSGLRRMYVTDTSGRRWYVPRDYLRAIATQIEALRTVDGRVEGRKP